MEFKLYLLAAFKSATRQAESLNSYFFLCLRPTAPLWIVAVEHFQQSDKQPLVDHVAGSSRLLHLIEEFTERHLRVEENTRADLRGLEVEFVT